MIYLYYLVLIYLFLLTGCSCLLNYKVTSWGKSCAMRKDFTFRTLIDQSVSSCVKECENRSKCTGILYWSTLNMCYLLTSHVINDGTVPSDNDQCIFVDKNDIVSTSEAVPCNGECGTDEVCHPDTNMCSSEECVPPVSLSSRILGNSYAVGSSCVEHVLNGCFRRTACLRTGQWTSKDTISCDALVFHGVTGNGVDPYLSWIGLAPSSEVLDTNRHFRNPVVNDWINLGIKKVQFSVYKGVDEVAYVIFNGTGTDQLTWFHNDTILRSSWIDMTQQSYNFFSVVGHVPGRRFFISVSYSGCAGDRAYFVALSENGHPCDVDNQPAYPTYMYQPSDTIGVLADTVAADYIEIYIST